MRLPALVSTLGSDPFQFAQQLRGTMLNEVYERLMQSFGPQHWWPAESRLEVIVGAVLTQNTAWTNVEQAIENLRAADLISVHNLAKVEQGELEELIRPAGYFRLKAKRLRNVVEFILRRYDGSLDRMFATGLSPLRNELLQVNGIGPETADSILLYAGGLPTFVVDTYAARMVKRHGWIELEADYYALQDYFQSHLTADAALYNEFHALIVRLGKDYCRNKPKCEGCPLETMLPRTGPIDLSGGSAR